MSWLDILVLFGYMVVIMLIFSPWDDITKYEHEPEADFDVNKVGIKEVAVDQDEAQTR